MTDSDRTAISEMTKLARELGLTQAKLDCAVEALHRVGDHPTAGLKREVPRIIREALEAIERISKIQGAGT